MKKLKTAFGCFFAASSIILAGCATQSQYEGFDDREFRVLANGCERISSEDSFSGCSNVLVEDNSGNTGYIHTATPVKEGDFVKALCKTNVEENEIKCHSRARKTIPSN